MEIELKYIVSPPGLESLVAAMRKGKVSQERLQARYFDTADGRLAARSVSLRLRREGDRWIQTVKALTPDLLRRLEHNVERMAPPGGEPALDVALHDGSPAGAALRAALAGAGADGLLVERFHTEVDRLIRLVTANGAKVELALDIGRVAAGDRHDAICELELELKSGPVSALYELAHRWSVDRGLWLSTVSKAERGGRLVQGAAAVEPVMATPPEIDARAGSGPFLAAVFGACLRQVLGNASELGVGHDEEGFVHQLRVGLRRLRTALRELEALVEGVDPAWEATFHRAFQALGAHRDAEAVLPKIREQLRAAGLHYEPPDVGSVGAEVPTSPADIVHAAAFQRALLAVMAFGESAALRQPPARRAKKRLQRALAKRLDRLHRALAGDARRFARLSPERQHDARKRLKRLRYLSEFAAPLFGRKRVGRYLKSWRAAQDALGELNDYHVGLASMRADTAPGSGRRHAICWTIGRLQTLAGRCERTLRTAAAKKAFWLG